MQLWRERLQILYDEVNLSIHSWFSVDGMLFSRTLLFPVDVLFDLLTT